MERHDEEVSISLFRDKAGLSRTQTQIRDRPVGPVTDLTRRPKTSTRNAFEIESRNFPEVWMLEFGVFFTVLDFNPCVGYPSFILNLSDG